MTRAEMNAFMKKESRRASLMAQLRGYVPMEEGATDASHRTEYLALMGEPYRSAQDEAAEQIEVQRVAREAREAAEHQAELDLVATEKANGFQDCYDLKRALGFGVQTSWHSVYHWVEGAGLRVITIVPDGRTDISKPLRTGIYEADVQLVVDYREAYLQEIRDRQHAANVAQAMNGGLTREEAEEVITRISEAPTARRETNEPQPTSGTPVQQVMQEAAQRRAGIAEEQAVAAEDLDVAMMDAMESYTGPRTKRGKPKVRELRLHFSTEGINRYITSRKRNQLWRRMQEAE